MNPEIIGQRIALRREQLGLTQEDLGALTGMEQQHIWRYENGKNKPSLDKLVILAGALRTSIDWLVGNAIDEKDLSPQEKEALEAFRRIPVKRRDAFMSAFREFARAMEVDDSEKAGVG